MLVGGEEGRTHLAVQTGAPGWIPDQTNQFHMVGVFHPLDTYESEGPSSSPKSGLKRNISETITRCPGMSTFHDLLGSGDLLPWGTADSVFRFFRSVT